MQQPSATNMPDPEPEASRPEDQEFAGWDRIPPELSAQVFEELRAIARHKMTSQQVGHTLQATALVNEVYLKIQGIQTEITDRNHLVCLAARAMRQILVDHNRRKASSHRPPPSRRIEAPDALDHMAKHFQSQGDDIEGLDQALAALERRDPELVMLVELRTFGGLTLEECATELAVPLRTIERRWKAAKGVLRLELARLGYAPPSGDVAPDGSGASK